MKEAEQSMVDPWARCDLDDWTIEEIYGNALLDPLPVGWEEDFRDCRNIRDNVLTLKIADDDRSHKRKQRRESRRARRRRLRAKM